MNSSTVISFPQLLMNFVVLNHWTHFVILSDKDVRRTVKLISTVFITSTFIRYTPNSNTSSQLVSSNALFLGHQHIIAWCSAKCKQELIETDQNFGMFGKRFTWLFIQEISEDVNEFHELNKWKNVLNPTSSVFSLDIFFDLSADASHWRLMKLQYLKSNSSSQVGHIKMDGLNARKTVSGISARLPLQGYELKIGLFNNPPYAFVDTSDPEPKYSGFVVEVQKVLSKYLGFRCRNVLLPMAYGMFVNGSWNGIIGTVQRKELDMGAIPIILTLERLPVVEFSAYMMISEVVGVIPRPPSTSTDYNFVLYVEPLSMQIQLTCGSIFLIACVCMMLSMTINPARYMPEPSNRGHSWITEVMWTLICAMLQTGEANLTRHRPSQTVFLTFAFFAILIVKTYTSLLTAALTHKLGPKQFETLEEVLDSGKFGFTLLPNSAMHYSFKNAKSGTFQRVWNKIQSDSYSHVKSTISGTQLSPQTKNYVQLRGEHYAALVVKKSNCELETLKQRYLRTTMHTIFPKNSPLAEVVSLKILAMKTSGVLGVLQRKFLSLDSDPSACKPKPSMIIPLPQAIGSFFILFVGLLLAVLVFLVENVFDRGVKCSTASANQCK